MQKERRHHSKYDFISGLTGSIISVTSCHSLEVVRTRLNLQNATSSKNKYNGFIDAFRTIYREEGLYGYYKGYSATIVSVPTFFALFFTIYNKNKCFIGERYNIHGFANHLISSVTTGAICDIITNPLWLIRTRMQTQYLHVNDGTVTKYTGLLDAFIKIVKREGFFSLYKGLGASFIGLTHVGIQFPVYEKLKEILSQHTKQRLTSLDVLCASIISKTCAGMLTYPHVVIRTRLHDNRQDYTMGFNHKKVTIIQICKTILQTDGFRGFYLGLATDMIRVLPMNAITFIVYEKMSQMLENFSN